MILTTVKPYTVLQDALEGWGVQRTDDTMNNVNRLCDIRGMRSATPREWKVIAEVEIIDWVHPTMYVLQNQRTGSFVTALGSELGNLY